MAFQFGDLAQRLVLFQLCPQEPQKVLERLQVDNNNDLLLGHNNIFVPDHPNILEI